MMTIALSKKIAEQLLPDAKKWIRKSTDSLNDEVKQTVAACLLDMRNAGIINISAEDPLILEAAKQYLRARFGYDDKPERWETAYEKLKASLSLCGSYTAKQEVSDGEV